MNKVTQLILSSIAIFSLASCGPNDSSNQSNSDSGLKDSTSQIEISNEESSSSISSNEETYYHVTFLNYDDTLLYETDVLEGSEAIYRGDTPIKPEDDEFVYEFKGWDKDISRIVSDLTVKAEYSYTAKENWGSISWF